MIEAIKSIKIASGEGDDIAIRRNRDRTSRLERTPT